MALSGSQLDWVSIVYSYPSLLHNLSRESLWSSALNDRGSTFMFRFLIKFWSYWFQWGKRLEVETVIIRSRMDSLISLLHLLYFIFLLYCLLNKHFSNKWKLKIFIALRTSMQWSVEKLSLTGRRKHNFFMYCSQPEGWAAKMTKRDSANHFSFPQPPPHPEF